MSHHSETQSDPNDLTKSKNEEFPSTSSTTGARSKRTARKDGMTEKENDSSTSSTVDEDNILSDLSSSSEQSENMAEEVTEPEQSHTVLSPPSGSAQRMFFGGHYARRFRHIINEFSWKKTAVKITENYEEELCEPKAVVYPLMRKDIRFYKGEYAHEEGFSVTAPSNKGEIIAPQDLFAMINAENVSGYMSIVGQAGSGKTTTMRHIAHCVMAENDISKVPNSLHEKFTNLFRKQKRRYELLYFLDVKDISNVSSVGVAELLFNMSFMRVGYKDLKYGYSWIVENQSKVIIFLDGLEKARWRLSEIGTKIGPWDKANAPTIIQNLLSRQILPDVQLIVSSREYAMATLPKELRPTNIVALAGLDPGDVEQLFVSVVGGKGKEAWNELKRTSPTLVRLSSVPMILIFNAIVWVRCKMLGLTLPDSITGVMLAILSSIRRSDHASVCQQAPELMQNMARLAFNATKDKKITFYTKDLKKYELTASDTNHLMIGVPKMNFLNQRLIEGEDHIFFFSHQTLQEIFSALFLANTKVNILQQFVSQEDGLHSDHWSVVRRFLCGILLNKDISNDIKREFLPVGPVLLQAKQEILRMSLQQQIDSALTEYQRLELYGALYEANDADLIERHISKIEFTDVQLSLDGMHTLSSIMRRCNALSILHLARCGLDKELLDILGSNTAGRKLQVAVLDISGNSMDKEAILSFNNALENFDVGELVMENCSLTSSTLENLKIKNTKVWNLVSFDNMDFELFYAIGKAASKGRLEEVKMARWKHWIANKDQVKEMNEFDVLGGVDILEVEFTGNIAEISSIEKRCQIKEVRVHLSGNIAGTWEDISAASRWQITGKVEVLQVEVTGDPRSALNAKTTMKERFHASCVQFRLSGEITPDQETISILAKENITGQFRKLDVSRNEGLGPEGMHVLGNLVKNHEVKEIVARNCNPNDENVQKFAEGLGEAKFDSLDLSHLPGSSHQERVYVRSLLSLLPQVNEEIKLQGWKINEIQQKELQDKLNEICSPTLSITLGDDENPIELKARDSETGLLHEIQHYIEKLESSVSKEERLKLLHGILKYKPSKQRDIVKTIRSINFSGITLQSQDVPVIGSVINHSAHLDSVNLKACKLLPGSLQILRNTVMNIVKVDKFRVDGNPNLTVDDLIAGVDLCARVGARFVYDHIHLSANDRQTLESDFRKYKPKEEDVEKKMSKNRKSMIQEERYQKMYKKPSSNENERRLHVMDFNSILGKQLGVEPEERSKEYSEFQKSASNIESGRRHFNSKLEEQLDVEPAERIKEDSNVKMSSEISPGERNIASLQFQKMSERATSMEGGLRQFDSKSDDQLNVEPADVDKLDTDLTSGESLSGTKRKNRPLTLKERVKMKPVMKFNEMLQFISSGEEILESRSGVRHTRILKAVAMNSDRRRFELASSNNVGSNLRSCMARLEVSTGTGKTGIGDSGLQSSFSEIWSGKANRRKYLRSSDQDTERENSIESTRAASLGRIEEVGTSAEKSGSSDSGISPTTGTYHQKHEHDPKRLIEQRFEMTVLGLGPLQNRREQLQLWMENAQFDVLPTDLDSELVDKSAKRLSTLVLDEDIEHELIYECAKSLSTLVMSGGYFIPTEPPEKLQSELSIAEGLEEEILQSERRPESDGFSSDMLEDEGKSEGLSSIEDVVGNLVEELLWQLKMKETSTTTLTVSKRESARDFVRRLTAEFGQTCKRKAFKIRKISPGGGSIWLYGYEIIFPPGAVEEATYIRISLDNNPQNFPKHGIAISCILECHPSKFKVPVLVRLTTWLSAKPGKKIRVTIMSKPDAATSWKEIQTVALGEKNVIEYKTLCFCGHLATTTNDGINDISLHLINDVWMNNNKACIISLFFKDEKTFIEETRRLKHEDGYDHVLAIRDELTVCIGNTIAVEFELKKPPPPPPAMMITSIDEADGKLEVNQEMVKKSFSSLVFELEPHSEDMQNVRRYRFQYRAKHVQSEGNLILTKIVKPLIFCWPHTSTRRLAGGPPQTSGSSSHINVPHVEAQGNVYIGGHDNYIGHGNDRMRPHLQDAP